MNQAFFYNQEDCLGEQVRVMFRRRDLIISPDLRMEGITPKTIHATCFLGFVALKTQVATVDEVLGDFGMIHEAAHTIHIGEFDHPVSAVVNIAEDLEKRLLRLSDMECRKAGFDIIL